MIRDEHGIGANRPDDLRFERHRSPPAFHGRPIAIANAEPLRIGGKGTANGNDQFAGEVDNVFVTIGG